MSKSEIFDNYVTIALSAGIIKNAAEKPKKSRMSAEDISTIEALYGVKPEDQEYDYNIMEQAHPNSVIIAPSYDKVNGLVENENERHNIIVNQITKHNDGNLNHSKLAKNSLVKELLKLGNHLDNIHDDELRKLADVCVEQCTTYKKAALPAVALGVAAVAAIIGAYYYINYTMPSDQGVINNCEKAIRELNDVLEKQIPEDLSKFIKEMEKEMTELQTITLKYNKLPGITVRDAKTLVALGEDPSFKEQAETVSAYHTKCQEILEKIPVFNESLSRAENTNVSTTEDYSSNVWNKLKDLYRKVVPSDYKDAVLAMERVQESLKFAVKDQESVMKLAQEKAAILEEKLKAKK